MEKNEVPKNMCMKMIATRPLIFITTIHENGIANCGVFGAYTNLSSNEIGIAIGKPSHTYKNIIRTGEFVINIPGIDLVDKVEVFGGNCPTNVSEITLAKLSTMPSRKISPPHIEQCKASIECRFTKEMPIGYHNFVVGEVICGYCDSGLFGEDGYFDVVKAKVFHDAKYPLPVYSYFEKYIEA